MTGIQEVNENNSDTNPTPSSININPHLTFPMPVKEEYERRSDTTLRTEYFDDQDDEASVSIEKNERPNQLDHSSKKIILQALSLDENEGAKSNFYDDSNSQESDNFEGGSEEEFSSDDLEREDTPVTFPPPDQPNNESEETDEDLEDDSDDLCRVLGSDNNPLSHFNKKHHNFTDAKDQQEEYEKETERPNEE